MFTVQYGDDMQHSCQIYSFVKAFLSAWRTAQASYGTIRLRVPKSRAVSASAMPACVPMNDAQGPLDDVSMHSDAQILDGSHRALPVVSWVKEAGERVSFIDLNCWL